MPPIETAVTRRKSGGSACGDRCGDFRKEALYEAVF